MSFEGPLHVVGAAIVDSGKCLAARRGPGMALAGAWEFPGGKVKHGESTSSALIREIQEELGIEIEVDTWLGRGESVVAGRELVLDIFSASLRQGQLCLKEHSEARWIGPSEIEDLDWAEADRPVLPILRRVLKREGNEDRLPKSLPIVSVDWGKERKKRAVYLALPQAKGWQVTRATPPNEGWSLDAVLEYAARHAAPFEGSALVAVDAVIGLPAAFGRRTPVQNFPAAVEWLDEKNALSRSVRSPEDWSVETPFFVVGAGPGGRTQFVARAGGRSNLRLQGDPEAGGNPVFATSGIPGSVGSGSAALWRELLAARRTVEPSFQIWPFEVELAEVPTSGTLTLAESYPRACYGVALANTLPAAPLSIAKTDPEVRRERVRELAAAAWIHEAAMTLDGIEEAEAGEDDFDALIQAVALARLVDAGGPLASHLVDPTWEGGILGTGGLLVREPTARSSRFTQAARSSSRSRSPEARKRCPIQGCQKVFVSGRAGWDSHVGALRSHPGWQPTLRSVEERKNAFRREFPEWFRN